MRGQPGFWDVDERYARLDASKYLPRIGGDLIHFGC